MKKIYIENKPDKCECITGNRITLVPVNENEILSGVPITYDFGFYVRAPAGHFAALKAKPSTACFIKISEDDMRLICKHQPAAKDVSSLLVTDFQGYKANDTDIHEDIFFDPED
ncbi:MAG TPA: hypothetical protein VMV77_16805 [Bacteroidales bacterium]|nr:hypothetical protein [Bacteroidales bacterium]